MNVSACTFESQRTTLVSPRRSLACSIGKRMGRLSSMTLAARLITRNEDGYILRDSLGMCRLDSAKRNGHGWLICRIGQVAASSDLFLKEALTFFGDAATANSPQGAFDKGRRLA